MFKTNFQAPHASVFLQLLMESLSSNCNGCNGNRFDRKLKLFCIYFYLVAGKLAYETLAKNLMCLPSIKTLKNNFTTVAERFQDGINSKIMRDDYLY